MNIGQNIKIAGMSVLLGLGASSCESGLHGEKALEDVKMSALEIVDYTNLPTKEYNRLLEGEKQARSNSLWVLDGNVKAIKYWDSVKTDALVKKAYLEGAQMVRDSITSANLKKIAADSLKKVK